MVAYVCNPSTWQEDVQFEASLGNITSPCLRRYTCNTKNSNSNIFCVAPIINTFCNQKFPLKQVSLSVHITLYSSVVTKIPKNQYCTRTDLRPVSISFGGSRQALLGEVTFTRWYFYQPQFNISFKATDRGLRQLKQSKNGTHPLDIFVHKGY
jgi:hypothetical protein